MKYILTAEDGGTKEIEAENMTQAWEEARDWIRDCDWGDLSQGTIYVDVDITSEDGKEEDHDTVAVHQPEPDCIDGEEHDWQSPHEIVGGIKENPGCWGHGGGVIIDQCCMRCGCKRTEDTWAQRMDTGEQGLDEITYQPGYYAEQLAKYRKEED